MGKINFLLIVFILLIASSGWAQMQAPSELTSINAKRIKTTQTGMLVLGSWALINLAGGSIASTQTAGATKYFYQGNALWNTVNLGLAGFSLYTLGKVDPSSLSLAESIAEQQKIEQLLLFNAGLDVAYIIGGLGLKGYAPNGKNTAMLEGYGNALLLQGGFLLVFDSVLYYLLHKHGIENLTALLENIQLSSTGIGVSYSF